MPRTPRAQGSPPARRTPPRTGPDGKAKQDAAAAPTTPAVEDAKEQAENTTKDNAKDTAKETDPSKVDAAANPQDRNGDTASDKPRQGEPAPQNADRRKPAGDGLDQKAAEKPDRIPANGRAERQPIPASCAAPPRTQRAAARRPAARPPRTRATGPDGGPAAAPSTTSRSAPAWGLAARGAGTA